MKTIYVAGASAEAEMVAGYLSRLRDAGIVVTFDWTVDVLEARAKGVSDRHLDDGVRAALALHDLAAVGRADLVWLLMPDGGSFGASFEFGAAVALARPTVVSGDWRRSIFTELADVRFDAHESALRWLTGTWARGAA